MSPDKAKKKSNGGSVIGHGLFVGATTAAVVVSIVLIVLGRVSSRPPAVTVPPTSTSTTGASTSAVIAYGTSLGAPNAPVTLVIYSDFQCHFCQQFAIGIQKQVEATYVAEGKVRMVYKHIVAFGDESELAAEAAECAAEQNQFWPYHDLLMQLNLSPSTEDLTVEKLIELAGQLGLNTDTFSASLASGKFKARVDQEDTEGRGLGITGLPAFYFNGVKADDSIGESFENFREVIEDALASSNK